MVVAITTIFVLIIVLFNAWNIFHIRRITEFNKSSIIKTEVDKYQKIFDSIRDAIFLIDEHDLILECNYNVTKLIGWNKQEIVGKPISDFINTKVNKTETTFNIECKTMTGELIEIDIFPVNVDYGDNFFTYIICKSGRDINLFKRVKMLNETLAVRVEALKNFQYTIAHDLNSPIRAIDGLGEILEKDYAEKLPDDAKILIGKIRNSVRYLRQLIKDIMKLSEISDGKLEIKRDHFSMTNKVKEICAELSRPIEKPIELKIEEGVYSFSDEDLVIFLLTNLLSNAFNFSSKKDKIYVEFGKNIRDGEVVYYIKDKGVGFDMKDYHKLFKPFSRLHSKKDFNGTGIGLTIVKQVATLHEGKVWAEAIPNEGATFYFTLGEKSGKN